ncbi:MAG: purine-binding chemotaxis protein CheW [Candidatus Latescibacterota bacterium]|jgi:purine-binding chemotaxis protein CheW
MTETTPVADLTELGGKYLTFFLEQEEYGLEILKVREIIGVMDITPVPRTPDFICGVINLRGKVIPVVDLRLKFAMQKIEQTNETCIIVVQAQELEMGIVVDRVSEVIDIPTGDIQPPPTFGNKTISIDYILGIGKTGERIKLLLNIDKVLSRTEMSNISQVQEVAA